MLQLLRHVRTIYHSENLGHLDFQLKRLQCDNYATYISGMNHSQLCCNFAIQITEVIGGFYHVPCLPCRPHTRILGLRRLQECLLNLEPRH